MILWKGKISPELLTSEKNTVKCVSLPSSHTGNLGDFKKFPTCQDIKKQTICVQLAEITVNP